VASVGLVMQAAEDQWQGGYGLPLLVLIVQTHRLKSRALRVASRCNAA
jgi:hypothetical protein